MKRIIRADLFRHGGLLGMKGFFSGLMIPGFRYLYLLRKATEYKKISFLGIFYRLLLSRYSYKYGFQIPVSTNIGEGFYIGHFWEIEINSLAIIGKNAILPMLLQ